MLRLHISLFLYIYLASGLTGYFEGLDFTNITFDQLITYDMIIID